MKTQLQRISQEDSFTLIALISSPLMSLPSSFLADFRLAFSQCRPRRAFSQRSLLHTSRSLNKRAAPLVPSQTRNGNPIEPRDERTQEPAITQQLNDDQQSKELIASDSERTSLDKRRKVEVPVKVLPKAQLGPTHKLSPEQRLHVEHLTRHPPPQRPPKGEIVARTRRHADRR